MEVAWSSLVRKIATTQFRNSTAKSPKLKAPPATPSTISNDIRRQISTTNIFYVYKIYYSQYKFKMLLSCGLVTQIKGIECVMSVGLSPFLVKLLHPMSETDCKISTTRTR